MITTLALLSLLLTALPALLFWRNLQLYRPLPPAHEPDRPQASSLERAAGVWPALESTPSISVLIPARDEEHNIAAALHSVLASQGIDFEVVVLDDSSADRTAEITRQIAATDPRVRLEPARPLPPGWCGKAHACHQLASLARHELLLFMDADVRLSDASGLRRLVRFMGESEAALVSGVPQEETRGLMEKLIIPLIHFVLLGFLPLDRMRASTDPRLAAACGQIIAVRRRDYLAAGGHEAIRDRLHDGVALARALRSLGVRTDLFDATDTFSCRMYQETAEVWQGFLKNAHEALATPRLILPATIVLGAQIAPFLLFPLADNPFSRAFAWAGICAAYLPRFMGVARFRQSLLGALLHPLGIALLIAIQWHAFFRQRLRRPATWKGRAYA